ncbi:phosphate ABC transporter substrate-binding protein [Oscillatoria sp. FACHB-1406]|uniref:phosphate ABC transporter substrate-binding protein n=1 Tax=Oscillatoria sp. FACHB-1406 TaxID=2692846 RepID=UPI001682DDDA|nr:phosphate ABC transporter substrate-binding protein [Oscillatoria sp. FACHB-1406]MBD2578681.1 phosphate ABC transporter substrate-binding protein [Oscillatoria sp. FACHB-1406]
MSQKNETVPLILALLLTLGIVGGGFWWFTRKNAPNDAVTVNNSPGSAATTPNTPVGNVPANPPPANNNSQTPNAFPAPATVPAGTAIRVNGSTSMVQINQALKNRFEQQFSGTTVTTQAGGTDAGIAAVINGSADVAAISRSLTPQEQSQGLVAVPVVQDAIAIVVGANNPFRQGLTRQQVVNIFTGQTTDWSAVGGKAGTLKVINRPAGSGTHQAFQELVLNKGKFGSGGNFQTLERDATTPLLRALGVDGIGYATYAQVANQQTVRVVAVDGLTPQAANYPFVRELSYAYKQPASPAVQAFLGFLGSPAGQSAVAPL